MAAIFFLVLFTRTLGFDAFVPDAEYTFSRFVADFSKTYIVGSAEYARRRSVFEENLADILAHNADQGNMWSRGINSYADLTRAEFVSSGRMGRDKSLGQHWANQRQAHTFQAPKHEFVPDAVDWRSKGVVSNVKDQGRCGSCWAFATTATVESHVALATGKLPVLSPQQLVSCAPNPLECGGKGACEGSIPEVAYGYVQLHGMTTEWRFPYTSYSGNAASTCAWNATDSPSVVQIMGYQKLPPNDYAAVMKAVAYIGPLAINVQADGWKDYESGIFDGCADLNKVDINHVVQLVGYGTDPKKGGDYWLVRNSWDVTWGEAGYIRLKRSSSAKCGEDKTPLHGTGCKGGDAVQRVCGTCGILFDVSYPLGAGMMKQVTEAIVV